MATKAKATTRTVELVALKDIYPSPENDELYGAIDPADNDLINLANDIARNGVREPIQRSRDGYIVTGHRRAAAAKLARLTHVPTVRLNVWRNAHSPLQWKQLLRAYNHQRVKTAAVRLNEALLDIDPEIAHEQLLTERQERDRDAPPRIKIAGQKVRCGISDRKQGMLKAVIEVVYGLEKYWSLTARQIHYGLLNKPCLRNSSTGQMYVNDRASYSDLCDLLTRARLNGDIPWEAIADETRPVSGTRYMKDAATFMDLENYHFLRGYRRDLMQSQPDHIELIVEKLTVQSIIGPVAQQYCIPMTVGRGYCSITPRYDIVQRFRRSGKDRLILLIAADFDPDGEEIAESFARSIRDDFGVRDVVASKILLRQDQVCEWKLPHNGLEAKESSSKFKKFLARYGENSVYELEAVPPDKTQEVVREAFEATIDLAKFNQELAAEKEDAARLQAAKNQIADLFSNMSGNGGAL